MGTIVKNVRLVITVTTAQQYALHHIMAFGVFRSVIVCLVTASTAVFPLPLQKKQRALTTKLGLLKKTKHKHQKTN
nr:uncharacterized protein LOC117682006 isoform X3 [Crassostrea gigas]